MANFLNQNKIIFLGTGGGGSMTGLQTLATAGTWLKLGEVNFYIDPGPGAVWHLRHFSKEKLDPTLLDAVLISHRHQDHCEGLGSLIEAMVYQPIIKKKNYQYRFNNQGKSIFLPADALDEKEGLVTSRFHLNLIGKTLKLKPETEYQVKNIRLRTTKRLLEKPFYKNKFDEYGFWFLGEAVDIGYLPETTYKNGLLTNFRPKILVANFCYYEHDIKHAFKIIHEVTKGVKPKILILRHWSRRSLLYGLDKIAREVQAKTGIKTIAAKDGLVFNF